MTRFTKVKQLEGNNVELTESKQQVSIIDLAGLEEEVARLKKEYDEKLAILKEIKQKLPK
ncbi:hypothetical protein MYX07_00400 [Patescibacteria group bacterium AH-259-L07]|nr:hypothetical protein [Patescibacteria group bacterium AH-259-L07]